MTRIVIRKVGIVRIAGEGSALESSRESHPVNRPRANFSATISITGATLARVGGKTVSFTVLCHIPHEAGQDIQVKFTTNSSDQVTGSIQNARDHWKWIVMAGCVVPPEASLAFVGIYRSFAKPPNDVPFHIQKLVIVEATPKGGM